jgi:two-component system sensor histidine kinase DegS
MKKFISWSAWSITTKILTMFLGLSVISMGIVGAMAIINIRDMGSYALETSSSLGERAIQDSTIHLNKLGEEIIKQKAIDVAKQIEMYLKIYPAMTLADMRNDEELRQIVVQPVGATGYTTLIDPQNMNIVIHKFPEQEKNLISLKEAVPSFWALLESSAKGMTTSGYYDWLELDGSINQKYASIVPVETSKGDSFTLWATTYITEFSMPVEDTKEEIRAAILDSSNYINENVSNIQGLFSVLFATLIIIVIGLSLLLSKVITSPIQDLNLGAKAIGQGNLSYRLEIKNKDELGDLANSFNKMSSALYTSTAELKRTAAENIDKERKIQENLLLVVQKVSEAQEAERKRIARELHDETVQDLVVVARQLDDLDSGGSRLSAQDIRQKVQKILAGVRHFSQELRPSILDDLGLVAAVQWLALDINNNYGIAVETEIAGNQPQFPPEVELMLFRITQEALTNVRKHSEATQVLIKLDFSEHKVKVLIHDNGIGFDIPSKVGDFTIVDKLGLVGMQERVQLLRGVMSIESQPGKGTSLTVEVPIVKIDVNPVKLE